MAAPSSDLKEVCGVAIDASLDDATSASAPNENDPCLTCSAAYVAGLAAAEIAAVFPTVSPRTAFRWVLTGEREAVPDVRVVPTSEMTADLTLSRRVAGSTSSRGASAALSTIIASLSDGEECATSVRLSVDGHAYSPYWDSVPGQTRFQALALSLDVAEDMMASRVPKSIRMSGKVFRRASVDDSTREYRPRPPRGWQTCVAVCLYLALCDRMGIDETSKLADRLAVTKADPRWVTVSTWLKDRKKGLSSVAVTRGASDEYVEISPHNFYHS